MKTKLIEKILITAFIIFNSSSSFGQGFNVGVNVGYGFSAGSSVIDVESTSSTDKNIKGSFGQGLNLGLNFNYMFSEHVGADLGLGFLMGKEFTATSNGFTSKAKGSMIRIAPGIKVSAGDDKSVSPYGRFGFLVGVGGKIKSEWSTSSDTYEFEQSGGISLGWYGAFGLAFKLSDKIKLNTELTSINQSYAPTTGENTARSDGQSLDPKETYENEVNNSAVNTDLKTYNPFSSIGLNVGIQIGF